MSSSILVIKNEDNGEYISIEDKINDYNEQISGKEYNISSPYDRHIKQELKSIIKQLEKEKKELLKELKKQIDLELDHPNYEYINVLSENSDSIYSPEYERNYKDFGPRRGQIYVNVDLVSKTFADTLANILKGYMKNV